MKDKTKVFNEEIKAAYDHLYNLLVEHQIPGVCMIAYGETTAGYSCASFYSTGVADVSEITEENLPPAIIELLAYLAGGSLTADEGEYVAELCAAQIATLVEEGEANPAEPSEKPHLNS